MKSTRTKIAALLLVAVMGITVGGCSKGDSSSNSTGNSASVNADANGSASDNSGDSSQEVETIDASDASLKQNMIFLAEDATPGGNAATNSNSTKTEVGGNSDDEYVVVTDANGKAVTDTNGKQVTTPAKTTTANGNSNSSNGSSNNNASSGDSSSDNYQPNMTRRALYWLDMSEQENFVFNGETIVLTFKIKDNAADGNYAVNICKETDFADYSAEGRITADLIDGTVTVGNATPEEARNAQSGKFTVSVGSASGKDGDEVKVPINFSDNPGLVGMIFWFEYDSNALELVPDECGVGADAADYITFQGN